VKASKKQLATPKVYDNPKITVKGPQQARSVRTVQAILEATAYEIDRIGLDKLTTKRIAEAAEISIGGLYKHFPNKEAIVQELTVRWLEQNRLMIESFDPRLTGCQDLLRYLDDITCAALKIYSEQPGIGTLVNALASMPILYPILIEHDEHVTQQGAKAICHFLPKLNKKTAEITAKTLSIISHDILCEIVLRDSKNADVLQRQLRTVQYALVVPLMVDKG